MYYTSAYFRGWFRLKGKSRETFDIIVSTKYVFLKISILRGYSPATSPPVGGAPVLISLVDTRLYFLLI